MVHKNFSALSLRRVALYAIVVIGVGGLCAHGWYAVAMWRAQVVQQQSERQAADIVATIPVWHKKIATQQTIRIGMITDTHVHATRIVKSDKRDDAPRRLKSVDAAVLRRFTAQATKNDAAFLVHLGDVIEGTGEENVAGIVMIKTVVTALERAGLPIYWSIGNHDLRAVTKEQFRETVDQPSLNYAWDVGDYRFVVLDLNADTTVEEIEKDVRGETEAEEVAEIVEDRDSDQNEDGDFPIGTMEWLREQLATDKRVFIFCHYPFDTETIISADGVAKVTLPFAEQMRALFHEYRVDGVFSGHVEAQTSYADRWTRYYLLTGTKKSKTYPEGFYDVTITAAVPDVVMHYRDPLTGALRTKAFE